MATVSHLPRYTVPTLREVDSSNIARIGYDHSVMHLYVEFRSGTLYRYLVPPVVYEQFCRAESLGVFLNNYIKGEYPSERVVLVGTDLEVVERFLQEQFEQVPDTAGLGF